MEIKPFGLGDRMAYQILLGGTKNPTIEERPGFSVQQLLSSPSMAILPARPGSRGFVLDPALMEGSRPPSVTGNHLSPENILLSFRGQSHRKINCYSGSSTSGRLPSPLSVLVLGKLIGYIYTGPLVSGIYFACHLLNLVHPVLSREPQLGASNEVTKRDLSGYR